MFAKSFASLAVAVDTNTSPAFGTPLRPKISTGVDGPAVLILFPLSSDIALTLPWLAPAAIFAPTFNVPFCTRTVATGPLPLSSLASIIIPLA